MVGRNYLIEFCFLGVAVFGIIGHNGATGQSVQGDGTKNMRGCTLPPHPVGGQWDFSNPPPTFAGMEVPLNTILFIRCNETFKLEGGPLTVCMNGKWFPPVAQCAQTCRSINSTSTLSVKCTYKGQQILDCVEPKDGTMAEFKCKSFYEDTRLLKSKASCIDGRWSEEIPECTLSCGEVSSVIISAVGGDETKQGEFPWQVALYRNIDKMQKCGGSLLSERVVLTAAHCITDKEGNISPKEDFIIVAGKYFREFNHTGDSKDTQVSEIEHMSISDEYGGGESNFEGDIAVMVTKKVLRFSSTVQPVCIDWDGLYTNEVIDSDVEKGYVSGWGYTEPNSKPSNKLKSLTVSLISRKSCRNVIREDYKRFLTSDKFCAGYLNNGTSVCSGDSGGGLVFIRDGRYFIAGVVSLAPLADSQEGGCDIQRYSLYTLVSKYTNNLIMETLAPTPKVVTTQLKETSYDDDGPEDGFGSAVVIPSKLVTALRNGSAEALAPTPTKITAELIRIGDDYGGHGHEGLYVYTPPLFTQRCWLPEPKYHPYRYNVLSAPEPITSQAQYAPFNTVIKINCTKKYKYDGPDISVCTNSGWSPSFFNKCIKKTTCPSLYISKKMHVLCTLNGEESECSDPLVDTVAKFKCAPSYQSTITDPKPPVCLNGQWSFIPECVPACGTTFLGFSILHHPWRVGIYDSTTRKLICEGSLITTKIIITASQCVTDTMNRLRRNEDFIVAVGKRHPDYDYPDARVQLSLLREILVQDSSKSDTGNYQSDVAVLVAAEAFKLSDFVQVVCVDFRMVPPTNTTAYVNPRRSIVSLERRLAISGQTCFDSVKKKLNNHYTGDKFCARFIKGNGSACAIDAGAGLVVRQAYNKFYLVGVSTLTADDETCDDQEYGLFTRIDHNVYRLILQAERTN